MYGWEEKERQVTAVGNDRMAENGFTKTGTQTRNRTVMKLRETVSVYLLGLISGFSRIAGT